MYCIPNVPYDRFSKVIYEAASEEDENNFSDYLSTDNSFPVWRVVSAKLHCNITWIFKVLVFGYYKDSDDSYEGGPIIIQIDWNIKDDSLKVSDVDFSDCSQVVYIPGFYNYKD